MIKKFNLKSIKEIFLRIRESVIGYYLLGLVDRLGEHNIFLISGGLAFSFIICIIPFVLIVLAIIGSILEHSVIENQIDIFIYRLIPYEDYASFVKNIIDSRLNEVKLFKNWAGYIGVIGLFFAASGVFTNMRTILNNIFNAHKSKNLVAGKARDFAMILIVVIFFLLSTATLPLLELLKNFIDKIDFLNIFRLTFIAKAALSIVSLLITIILFYGLYYFIPYGKIPVRVAATSAVCAATLWALAEVIFGYYLAHFAAWGRIYGAYVFGIVILFWIYYSAVIFIIGAEIGGLYHQRKQKKMDSLF
ncbi:MAG: YihY/virulence factor BrkB family protein [bacterium]|nr:YihY/virulence factor BrkB family protein [bacterium]